MKTLLLIPFVAYFFAAIGFADDSRFRFIRMAGVTGLPCEVSDESGKTTTIIFAKDSDPTAEFILDSLLKKEGIWGRHKADVDPRGIIWDQGIVLIGTLSSEEKVTEYVKNGAQQEPYKEFRFSGIQVEMPFAQWVRVQADKEDPLSMPYVVVYHLSLESIFPKGLSFEGKFLDLRSYETKSKSEQTSGANHLPFLSQNLNENFST